MYKGSTMLNPTQDIAAVVIPKLQEGERRIFYIEVGNLSPAGAAQYLERVRTALTEDNTSNIFVATRSGIPAITFETIKDLT